MIYCDWQQKKRWIFRCYFVSIFLSFFAKVKTGSALKYWKEWKRFDSNQYEQYGSTSEKSEQRTKRIKETRHVNLRKLKSTECKDVGGRHKRSKKTKVRTIQNEVRGIKKGEYFCSLSDVAICETN